MKYIERETAIDKILSLKTSGAFTEAFKNAVLQALGQEPAADVAEVRHGQWQKHYKSGTTVSDGFVSSCCDMWNERETPYCPHCGAKMDGKDGE